MAKEIERKFLVTDQSYKQLAERKEEMRQAYISAAIDATVRLRITDDKAFLTVKTRNLDVVRDEWEYEIPVSDAEEMMQKCARTSILSKTRWFVGPWMVDEYHGHLEGLAVAEIELKTAEEPVPHVDFIGKEVSDDPRYFNSTLALADRIPD